MQLKPGTLLQGGKYKIVRFIKSGGFGCTYEAWNTVFEERVAIKEFFPKDFCNRDDDTLHVTVGTQSKKPLVSKLRKKFIDEAKAIRKLPHPGIVTVSDVFEENGTAYYVMDYIDGCSLDEIVKRDGALPEQTVLEYTRQVCLALGYVHSQNRLHLDIKPGNIMIDASARAVLIDFGTSKQYDEVNGENTSTLLGMTPGYAPLEQNKRGGVSQFTPATDIYSVGATLYKLLTGLTPPDADEVNENGLPPLPSSVSASTRVAVETAMSPKRKDRPQSIEAFLDLLDTPVVTVSDEETKTVDSSSEKSDSSSSGNSDTSGSSSGLYDHNKPYMKKWLWSLLTGFAVVVVVLLAVFRPFEPDDLSSDLSDYNYYLHQGDSLSMHEESLSEAISAYDSASAYEQKYSGSRYSRRFRGVASSKSASVQSRIDSIRVSDSLAKIAAFEAAAARAELERQEQERKQREAYEGLKRSSSYKNGVLKVGSVEYPMVYVSGGSFDMGATPEQGSDAFDNEKPVHRVTLSGYSIGKYEVTQDLWEAVMGSNPSYHKGSRRPVESVSWNMCQDFIRKLNELTGAHFRLPTEAEWEFAARGGNSSRGYKYSGSDAQDDVAWYDDNSGDKTHDVGTKSPNELGLYDMSGNVWEWCNDGYGSYSSSSQTDPKGASSGSYRVYRGGSWNYSARNCRVSVRKNYTPLYTWSIIGLRLCH